MNFKLGDVTLNDKWESLWGWKAWRKSLALMLSPPPSPGVVSSSWRRREEGGGHLLFKVTVTMAILVLVFFTFQNCAFQDTTLPDWSKLSFTSRTSNVWASTELIQRPHGRPPADFLPSPFPASSPSPSASNFPVVNSCSPLPSKDEENRDSDFGEQDCGNFNYEAPVTTGDGSPANEDKDDSEVQDGNFSGASRAQEAFNSTHSAAAAISPNENGEKGEQFVTPDGDNEDPATSVVEILGPSTGIGIMEQFVEVVAPSPGSSTIEARVPNDDAGPASASPGPKDDVLASFTPLLNVEVSQSEDKFAHQDLLGFAPSPSPTIMADLKPVVEMRARPEQELLAAKRAIDAVSSADKDASLYPVIYNNVSAFSKSYKLMEEMFRIYVYSEKGNGEPEVVHTAPVEGIYATEGIFISQMSKPGSAYVERDPEKAHMFFLPYSVTEMTLTMYVEGSNSMLPLTSFVKDYVNEVASKYPFWNRTRGADHFFVSCHDWGPFTTREHEELRKNAVKVLCNADLTEEFVLGKDASLPEIYIHSHKMKSFGGPGPTRRQYLAFFAGQMHGHVRPVLIENWKDKDPDMKFYDVLHEEIETKVDYVEHMKLSKFCICPAGHEVNSPRIVESIYYDCVPVIIADNFVLPFSDVLNWSTFSVTIPENRIPELKSILLSIPEQRYQAMQRRLAKVRQHFLWDEKPVKYDVFHMILHSVWMSRLNRLPTDLHA